MHAYHYKKKCTWPKARVKRLNSTGCPDDNAGPTTDNNNLFWAARVLEEIYTNKNYAPAPHLGTSLRDSGKARADLWAFAALVATQYAERLYNKNYCTALKLNKFCEPKTGFSMPRAFTTKGEKCRRVC